MYMLFSLILFLLLLTTPIRLIRSDALNPDANDGVAELPRLPPSTSSDVLTNSTNSSTINGEAVWRKLTVNETVTRGSHVRLDMTTGERFVKVDHRELDSDDEPEESVITHHVDQIFTMLSRVDDDPALMAKIEELREVRRANRLDEYKTGVQKLWTERQEVLMMGFKKEREKQKLLGAEDQRDDVASRKNSTGEAQMIKPTKTSAVVGLLQEARSTADLILSTSDARDSRVKEESEHFARLAAVLSAIEEEVEDLKEAEEFYKHGGFEKCYALMDSFPESERVSVGVARVMGTAVKNHSPFQEYLAKSFPDIPRRFIAMMVEERTENHGVFAIGSLLRGIFDKVAPADGSAALRLLTVKLYTATAMGGGGESRECATEKRLPALVVERVSALIGDLAVESAAARRHLRTTFCAAGENEADEEGFSPSELMTRLKCISASSPNVRYLLDQLEAACE